MLHKARIFTALMVFIIPAMSYSEDDIITWDEYKLHDKKLKDIIEPFYRNIGLIVYDEKLWGKYLYVYDNIIIPNIGYIYLDGRPERSASDTYVKNFIACKLGKEAVLSAIAIRKNIETADMILNRSVSFSDIPAPAQIKLRAELYPELPTLSADDIVSDGPLPTGKEAVLESMRLRHVSKIAGIREFRLEFSQKNPNEKEIIEFTKAVEKFVNNQWFCITRNKSLDYTSSFEGNIPW